MTGSSPPEKPPRPDARPVKGEAPRPASSKGAAPIPKRRTPEPPAPPAPRPAAAKPPTPAPPPAVMKAIAAQDPLIGTTLGRVRLDARIGSGKTAVVYRGHHTALDATVAVKVLTPEARAFAEVVEKFATEARAIAKIDNENVLKIYDVGQEGGQHYLVMELLEGESILDLITREGRLDSMDALRVARQTANGLAAAHGQGIIHRDVKPGNLVLLEDGTVKLVDFGLAARDDAGSQRVGTPHYMAPEVCESGQAEPVSDVYALGVSLHHMLTGEPPYAGRQVKEILQAHIKGDPLYPERKVPGLAREVAELVRKLTKRDPLLRPSAADVVVDLDRIGGQDLRQKETLRGRRSRARGRTSTSAARSPAVAIIAGIVVVAVVVAFVAFSGGSGNEGPSGAGSSQGPVYPPGKGPESNVPLAPPVHVETPKEREEREKREAEAAKQKKEFEAGEDLKGIESWIRAKWQTKSDDEAVLSRYRNFVKSWKGTEAAKAVEERIRQIAAGRVHPHPDRTYGDVDEVETVRKKWSEALPLVEERIAKHEYLQAQGLVPAAVEDGGGTLSQELRFWRQALEHLSQFQSGLATESEAIPAAQRTLALKGGTVPLKKVIVGGAFEVEEGGSVRRIAWAEAPPAEIVRLARAAFAEKDTGFQVLCLAFAWAHRLSDEYWGALLDVEGAGTKYAADAAGYKRTWEDRLAAKK